MPIDPELKNELVTCFGALNGNLSEFIYATIEEHASLAEQIEELRERIEALSGGGGGGAAVAMVPTPPPGRPASHAPSPRRVPMPPKKVRYSPSPRAVRLAMRLRAAGR